MRRQLDRARRGRSGLPGAYAVCLFAARSGPGTFAHLQLAIDPADARRVVISHHHPDHWTDLHALATHAKLALEREVDRSTLRLPWRRTTGLDGSAALRLARRDRPVTRWRSGTLACTFRRTDQVFETLAVRIDGGGRALGYSADIGPGWPLGRAGRRSRRRAVRGDLHRRARRDRRTT